MKKKLLWFKESAHLLIDLKKNEKIKKILIFFKTGIKWFCYFYELNKVIKYKVKKNKSVGDILLWKDLK